MPSKATSGRLVPLQAPYDTIRPHHLLLTSAHLLLQPRNTHLPSLYSLYVPFTVFSLVPPSTHSCYIFIPYAFKEILLTSIRDGCPRQCNSLIYLLVAGPSNRVYGPELGFYLILFAFFIPLTSQSCTSDTSLPSQQIVRPTCRHNWLEGTKCKNAGVAYTDRTSIDGSKGQSDTTHTCRERRRTHAWRIKLLKKWRNTYRIKEIKTKG
jgi:hypothetical protein